MEKNCLNVDGESRENACRFLPIYLEKSAIFAVESTFGQTPPPPYYEVQETCYKAKIK